MREIGRIKQVQVQQASLKIAHGSHESYNPAPLLVVPRLRLSPQGAIGLTLDNREIIDIHNAAHPASRNNGGFNGISFGFTAYYEQMRTRLGTHMIDGIAGENILIESNHPYTLSELQNGIIIQSETTGTTTLLTEIGIAYPCLPFSTFATQEEQPSPERIKTTLQFLHNGRRGFYASLIQEWEAPTVQAGDMVFTLI